MRMRKSLTTLIAALGLLLTGLAAPILMSPADAAAPAVGKATTTSTVHQSSRALPKRNLHDTVIKVRGKLYFKGRVDPGKGPVFVQKRNCAKCKWKPYRKVATHGPKSKWHVRIGAPRRGSWFWRAYVPKKGAYGTSFSGVWRTYTI
jgi:hypothetical protein